MRSHVSLIALASSLPLLCAPAGAAVIFNNPPNVDSSNRVDGTFSDGMASDGLNFYSQAFGQGFQVTQSGSAINSIRIWGSSEFTQGIPPTNQGISDNIKSLEVSIMRVAGTSTNYDRIYNRIFTVATQVVQTATGVRTPGILTPVFQLDIDLGEDVAVANGSYILSIGGILLDPDGDSFIWSDGVADGAQAATQAYLSVGDTAAQWGYWNPVETGISGSMVLNGIPGPGAVALLALTGLRQGRRRA